VGEDALEEAMSERLTMKILAHLIKLIIIVLLDREKRHGLFARGHPAMRELVEWAKGHE
jgi:hypothetical protein